MNVFVPSDWTLATIGEIVGEDGVFTDGDWIESKDQDPSGDVRLVQLADVGEGEFRDRSRRFLTAEKAKALGCTFLEGGDILIARMPDPLGRACIYPGCDKPAVTAVDVCIVRPDDDLNREWLMWAINAPQFRSAISSLQSGSTRKRISRRNLGTLQLPLPPRKAQDAIAAEIEKQFTRLDAAVASLEQAESRLRAYRAALFRDAVRGTLVPGCPDKWQTARLGDVAGIQGGIQKQPKRTPRHNGYPFLRVANVMRGRLELAQVHEIELFGNELERLRLQAGDLLIVEGNGSPSEIGRMAIWSGEIPDCVHQNHIIRARLREGLLPRFVEIYWNSPRGTAEVAAVASSTSGLYTLSVRKVASLPVPRPPIEEQQRIVQEVSRRMSLIDAAELSVDKASRASNILRRGILSQAFDGRLVSSLEAQAVD